MAGLVPPKDESLSVSLPSTDPNLLTYVPQHGLDLLLLMTSLAIPYASTLDQARGLVNTHD